MDDLGKYTLISRISVQYSGLVEMKIEIFKGAEVRRGTE